MRRKIIKQGRGGCTISLPIEWIRKNKLEPGDEVELVMHGRNLTVGGGSGHGKKKTEFHFDGKVNKHLLRSVISSLYKKGYDEMVFSFDKLPTMTDLKEVISSFNGLEFLLDEGVVRICSFINSDPDELDKLIIKMFQIVKCIFSELLEKRSSAGGSQIHLLASDVLKLRDHCLRILYFSRARDENLFCYCDLIVRIEKLSSQLKHFGEYISARNKADSALLRKLDSQFNILYAAYLKKDFEAVLGFWQNHRNSMAAEFCPKNLDLLVDKRGADVIYYYSISTNFRQIASRILSINLTSFDFS